MDCPHKIEKERKLSLIYIRSREYRYYRKEMKKKDRWKSKRYRRYCVSGYIRVVRPVRKKQERKGKGINPIYHVFSIVLFLFLLWQITIAYSLSLLIWKKKPSNHISLSFFLFLCYLPNTSWIESSLCFCSLLCLIDATVLYTCEDFHNTNTNTRLSNRNKKKERKKETWYLPSSRLFRSPQLINVYNKLKKYSGSEVGFFCSTRFLKKSGVLAIVVVVVVYHLSINPPET